MTNLTYNTKIRELEIEAVRQGVESQLLTALVTLAYEFGMFVERKKRPLTFDEMLKNNSDLFKK